MAKQVNQVSRRTVLKTGAAITAAKRMIEHDGVVMVSGGSSSGVAIVGQGLCHAGG